MLLRRSGACPASADLGAHRTVRPRRTRRNLRRHAEPRPRHHLPPADPQRLVVPKGSLGAIVRAYKSATAKRINALHGTKQVPVWQRGYYERIIRDEFGLDRIRQYILDNPRKWDDDPNNPASFID